MLPFDMCSIKLRNLFAVPLKLLRGPLKDRGPLFENHWSKSILFSIVHLLLICCSKLSTITCYTDINTFNIKTSRHCVDISDKGLETVFGLGTDFLWSCARLGLYLVLMARSCSWSQCFLNLSRDDIF